MNIYSCLSFSKLRWFTEDDEWKIILIWLLNVSILPGITCLSGKNHRSSLPWSSGSNILICTEWKLVILYSSGNTQCIDETGNVALYHIMGSSTFAMIE